MTWSKPLFDDSNLRLQINFLGIDPPHNTLVQKGGGNPSLDRLHCFPITRNHHQAASYDENDGNDRLVVENHAENRPYRENGEE